MKRIALAVVFTIVVLLVGTVVSLGVAAVFASQLGMVLLSVAVLAALFILCWMVAGAYTK